MIDRASVRIHQRRLAARWALVALGTMIGASLYCSVLMAQATGRSAAVYACGAGGNVTGKTLIQAARSTRKSLYVVNNSSANVLIGFGIASVHLSTANAIVLPGTFNGNPIISSLSQEGPGVDVGRIDCQSVANSTNTVYALITY